MPVYFSDKYSDLKFKSQAATSWWGNIGLESDKIFTKPKLLYIEMGKFERWFSTFPNSTTRRLTDNENIVPNE